MAITWTLDISPINISTKEASIRATRTDDTDGSTMEYTIARETIDIVTMTNNIPILDEIWAKHQARLSKESNINDFTSGLEAAGKINLEGRE